MKRRIIFFVLLTTLGVGGVAVWRYVLPWQQVGDLYRRYEHADGIAASYIHNFPVNDTLLLDVTLLEATTDSAFRQLLDDLSIPEMDSSLMQAVYDNRKDLVFSKMIAKGENPKAAVDPAQADLVAVSILSRTATVFHVGGIGELQAVLHHNYDKSTKAIE